MSMLQQTITAVRQRTHSALSISALAVLLAGCAAAPPPLSPQTEALLKAQPPIRFLLTFDDGPSRDKTDNPTLSILHTLADNPQENGIKALFFVQTRSWGAGDTVAGQEIMRQEVAQGQLLGFHTATPFHSNHRFLKPEVLEQSLNEGISDITALQGEPPKLVRPPFWNYDLRTFNAYQQHGMHILLTDLSANDGKIYGIKGSLRRRSNLLHELADLREHIAQGKLPVVDGNIPVLVAFHDINSYTADHMAEYLEILTTSAREVHLQTAAKPFYDDRRAVERAALGRSVQDGTQIPELPGLWKWIWE
ncbi:polysaccharide deacetylase family protein [Silvimonas sp.]|uniref:polysaccharide deacetylase family protein n=1 Tax=Silvimonas sp. TaxID=2650811 RepID=UPI00284A1C51|nr:polysaccharide deacetylase family protein [Silvimonas sp.]MDR3430202.1 polysaccharide deacetylase family protein [Silvimonas sp.]